MTPLAFLASRHSVPSKLLTAPGPTDEQFAELLRVATRVPDHGVLTPWRIVRIAGAARTALCERIAARSRERNPDDAGAIEKDRKRFSYAPLVLAVIAKITPGHKVPEQEQLLSAGAVCMNLLLGAQALGYGAQWLTGWAAYDATVGSWFGLAPTERIVGFIHLGTTTAAVPERTRPDPATLLSDFA
jgi:nitroreductase